jgi:hypothetical protein
MSEMERAYWMWWRKQFTDNAAPILSSSALLRMQLALRGTPQS